MKKVSILACLLFLHSSYTHTEIKLNSPMLRIADNSGRFNAYIVDILLTRSDIIALIHGKKEWNGSVIKFAMHENKKISLDVYLRRPEIIFGATFVTISPDHESLPSFITSDQKKLVDNYLATVKNKSLYERQMNSTLEGVFTGSHVINPVSKELLPVYISDYAIECFDSRHSKTRIGIPAHNSKDFDFAKFHKLPIKIVVAPPAKESDSTTTTNLADKANSLKEAYLGEYRECTIVNSGQLDTLSLKDAANKVIEYIEAHNLGKAHKEFLKYFYNNQYYSIKDIVKIESALHKNPTQSQAIIDQKNILRTILVSAQADFLEIVEKFIVNIKNIKSLMIALIEESCTLRNNPDCYLLRWCHFTSDESEKDIFRRDITSVKHLAIFCHDLVNFLDDLAHSCPNALHNIYQ